MSLPDIFVAIATHINSVIITYHMLYLIIIHTISFIILKANKMWLSDLILETHTTYVLQKCVVMHIFFMTVIIIKYFLNVKSKRNYGEIVELCLIMYAFSFRFKEFLQAININYEFWSLL